MAEQKDRPDTRSAASREMAEQIEITRDVMEGTHELRKNASKYLPQHPAESNGNYRVRKDRACFFNAYERTVTGLTGMVFRRDVALGEDVPQAIRAGWEDVDLCGTHGDVFAKELFRDALAVGHAGLLVDMPRNDPSEISRTRSGAVTRTAENASGRRPYFKRVHAEDVVSWRFVRGTGGKVLQQLVLREKSIEPDGEYGEEVVTRYRVFRNDGGNVTWRLLREDSGEFVEDASGDVSGPTEIPFVATYGYRTGVLESRPPLIDLAHLNLAHFQLTADFWQSIHKANSPILTVIGADVDLAQVGPNGGLKVNVPDATVQYTEHSGSAHGSTSAELTNIERRMATLGLSMLMSETRAAETAEAKRIDKSVEDSVLAAAARSLQDTLEVAFGYWAAYTNESSGGSVAVNRDYEDLTLNPQVIAAYSDLVSRGQITLETMYRVLAEGGALPDEFDPDDERDRLEQKAMASIARFQMARNSMSETADEAA